MNGQSSTQLWQPYSTLANGTTLEFTLGTSANTSWGNGSGDEPPSFGAGNTFNNTGISDDNQSTSVGFDGGGYSYSSQALQTAGFNFGQTVNYNDVDFTWPNVGELDNFTTQGQTVDVAQNSGASTLAFLGSANNGPSTGTATIHYDDGSTQDFALGLSDWTLEGGNGSTSYNNGTVATLPYRNGVNGRESVKTYIFYTDVTL